MQLRGRCRRVQLQTRACGLSIVPRNQVSAGERGQCAQTQTDEQPATPTLHLLPRERSFCRSILRLLSRAPQSGCLKTTGITVSQHYRPEIQTQGVGGPGSLPGLWRREPSWLLPTSPSPEHLWIRAVEPQSEPRLPCAGRPYPSLAST